MGRIIHSNQDQSFKQHASKLFSNLYKLFFGIFQKTILFAKAKGGQVIRVEHFFFFLRQINETFVVKEKQGREGL